jgi:hypothetical protein
MIGQHADSRVYMDLAVVLLVRQSCFASCGQLYQTTARNAQKLRSESHYDQEKCKSDQINSFKKQQQKLTVVVGQATFLVLVQHQRLRRQLLRLFQLSACPFSIVWHLCTLKSATRHRSVRELGGHTHG